MGLLALFVNIATSVLQFIIFTFQAVLTVFFGTPMT